MNTFFTLHNSVCLVAWNGLTRINQRNLHREIVFANKKTLRHGQLLFCWYTSVLQCVHFIIAQLNIVLTKVDSY